MSRLEEGNTKDDSSPQLDKTMHNEHYGSITPEKVKICISGFKKNAPSGPDLLRLVDLKIYRLSMR